MVLEEATSGQEPSSTFDEPAPSSDIDPYASGNPDYTSTGGSSYILVSPPGANPPVYINLNDIPRRFSFLGPKAHPRALIRNLQEQCQMASGVLHRPVRQDEADALAFHLAKSVRISSYGSPVGIAFAAAQAWRTQSTMRFPGFSLFQEGGRFSPDRFGPFRGALARAQWQFLRLSTYSFVGAVIGQVFFGTYAISVSLAGRTMDPRLKEFTEAIKRRMEQKRGSVSDEIQKARAEGEGRLQGKETYEMARQRSSAMRGRNSPPAAAVNGAGAGAAADDMSPTSGAFEEEYMGQGASSNGLVNGGQVSRAASPTYETTQPQSQSRSQSNSSSPASNPSTQQASRPAGNAWDRLRQNAMSSGGQSQSGGRTSSSNTGSGNGNSGGDSFSFSQGEEDKQLAQSEAQKQFDARIEREREGRDFEDGRKGKRW